MFLDVVKMLQKKAHVLEALAGVEDIEPTQAAPHTTKSEAVEQQLNYWLRVRAPQLIKLLVIRTISFNSGEMNRTLCYDGLPSVLVALCSPSVQPNASTKYQKELWSSDRRSTLPESIARDVFIRANSNYYPAPNFDWKFVNN